jgi:hypothetical protein
VLAPPDAPRQRIAAAFLRPTGRHARPIVRRSWVRRT